MRISGKMKRHSLKVFYILALAATGPTFAQEGPAFDCAKAESDAETLVCADPDLAAIDRRLADVYARALDVASGLDAGAAEAEAELKATQRGWIKGRDECWKADELRTCVEAAYLMREAELVATWMLEEPMTEAAWTCGGNPSNVVFVTYYDTPLPGIRVEYGDGVKAMTLARTASGSRYDGPFGSFLWEHQGEVRFAWEEGAEQTCTLSAG